MLTAEVMIRFPFESFVWIVWHLRIYSKCRLKSLVQVIFVPVEKISGAIKLYKTNKKIHHNRQKSTSLTPVLL